MQFRACLHSEIYVDKEGRIPNKNEYQSHTEQKKYMFPKSGFCFKNVCYIAFLVTY